MSLPQVALPRVQEPNRAPRHTPRPAPQKKKRSFGRLFIGGVAWLAMMSAAFLLVERQTEIQRERQAMTKLTEEMQVLEQQNQEAASQLVRQVSVSEIETWASGHGMVRATAVKPLESDPKAVAARPQPETPATAANADSGFVASARSFWESLFAPLSAKGR
jgi:hypothetical protein